MSTDSELVALVADLKARAGRARSDADDAARMPEHRDDATSQAIALSSIAGSLSVIADVLVASIDNDR